LTVFDRLLVTELPISLLKHETNGFDGTRMDTWMHGCRGRTAHGVISSDYKESENVRRKNKKCVLWSPLDGSVEILINYNNVALPSIDRYPL
jgi:hypothetical protein